jgi:hypothetical protein
MYMGIGVAVGVGVGVGVGIYPLKSWRKMAMYLRSY